MKHTKIDWVDCTCNPVVGCKNGCPYCYARKLNDRFHFIDDWSKPKFFPERLKQFESKKPKSVFINSMSDIAYWEIEWAREVMSAIRENRQHTYIFLTKGGRTYPSGFHEIWSLRELYDLKKTVYIGKTVTRQRELEIFAQYDFLSIEPVLEPIDLSVLKHNLYTKAVIIGAETGKRKDKVVPKREWIKGIVFECDHAGVAVFMKESLRTIMGCDFRQDKLPWEKKQ